MIATLVDLAGLGAIAWLVVRESPGALLARILLSALKLVPLAALIFTFGPLGISWIVACGIAFAQGVSALESSRAGQAHLTAGLAGGILFASGPFGAAMTGAALAILAVRHRPDRSVVDLALLMFVPLIVIAGFSIAAQAQVGDPFALTAPGRTALSRLSVANPGWPAALSALALMPALAPAALAALASRDNARMCGAAALLGGTVAALLTFRDTLDGIAEAALAFAFAANSLTAHSLKTLSAALLLAAGGCALALCIVAARTAPSAPLPPMAHWRIAPASLDALPPWGVDHAY